MKRKDFENAFWIIDQMIKNAHQFSIYERSKRFSVLWMNRFYPPKIVFEIGMTAVKLPFRKNFTTGNAVRILKDFGFTIVHAKSNIF